MDPLVPPPDVSPRRLRADAQANRQRVLDAAERLFEARGVTVPLDDIAREARVGPGTLHRHFPSKDRLIAAVALDHLEALVAAAERRASESDPVAALGDQLRQMLAEADRHSPLKRALAGSPADVVWPQAEVSGRLRVALGRLLLRAQQDGGARPDLVAGDLVALLAGAVAALDYAGVAADSEPGRRLVEVSLRGAFT